MNRRKLSMVPPSKQRTTARLASGEAVSRAARELVEGGATRKRLSIDVSPEAHKSLKIRAAEKGLNIKQYIYLLLRQDGIPGLDGLD
jgi:predicted DNA binding CopG/RHH family protein